MLVIPMLIIFRYSNVDNVRYSNADTSIVISHFDSPTRQKSNVPPHLLWIFN